MFNSDLGRIKQILMNLISNAFKFTNQGGIKVTVRIENRIQDDLTKNRFIVFEVKDTGVGMTQKEMKNLFTMFSTADRHKQSMNIRGTGLGLTISKKLTEMLGGRIHVQSIENQGTTFTFDIKESTRDQDSDSELQVN